MNGETNTMDKKLSGFIIDQLISNLLIYTTSTVDYVSHVMQQTVINHYEIY